MADTGQSVCDCIQNNPCWQEWAGLYPPEGCCGCCEGEGCGGTCYYEWEGQYGTWHLFSSDCTYVHIPYRGGWLNCSCKNTLDPGDEDWPGYGDEDWHDFSMNCKFVFVIVLYMKGKNLIGINSDALKQRLSGGKVKAKQGCGTCGSKVRKQATINTVRQETLSIKKKKLF